MKKYLLLFVAALPLLAFAATGPTVSTDTRYARGATMAFARISVTGNSVSRQGICYATHPNPTIDDNVTTSTLSTIDGVTGQIYQMTNLQPSTKYYMRGFAEDANGNVGYGEDVRFYTLPKATISYTIREDSNNVDAVNRIRQATADAVNYWTNLTSIQGFYPNVGYNSGTPTADCSYGGYVRVGSNTSYQRTGTILHELLHGVGVGTNWIWTNNADMRTNTTRGYWLGERATAVIRFLANNTTGQLNGDVQHLWPFGINGAHEDNGSASLYIANSLVCQALGEDGLPLTSSMGFAAPYDAFDCEDTIKYYMRSEDKDHGLYTAFLKEEANGTLKWVTMTTDQATANDSTAWYFSYNPVNCFYTIKNAATGHYIHYNGTFRTMAEEATAYGARMQLLRGRVEAVNGMSNHGYFIAYNSHQWNSPVLSASDNGATTTGNFSFSNDATTDRWLILTVEESKSLEQLAKVNSTESLDDILKALEALLSTPHSETTSGSDAALQSAIESIRSAADTATTSTVIDNLIEQAYDAATTFLPGVTATYEDKPFDLTFMLTNPSVATTTGWEATDDDMPTMNYLCGEYYQKTFDFHQTIMRAFPRGYYRLKVQAFQRPGSSADTYTAWSTNATSPAVSTEIYLGLATAQKLSGSTVKNIWDDAQSAKVGSGTEASQGGLYVPNDMQSASAYFNKGLYDNTRDNRQYTKISATQGLKVGIRGTESSTNYWTIFRNFRLYYFGSTKSTTGIETVKSEDGKAKNYNVYNINGQLVRHNAHDLNGLPRGLYIVNGKKVIR